MGVPKLRVEEAQARILGGVGLLPVERLRLDEAQDRVLAADLLARLDQPPTDNSAMDGYAVRTADLGPVRKGTPDCAAEAGDGEGVPLEVVETIAAGAMPTRAVGPGQCARIMTGAPMPEGADSVVMRELTAEGPDEGTVRILEAGPAGHHVRRAGEDVRAGEVLLRAGEVLHAGRVGLLAGQGLTWVEVHRRPVVGILATGDEIQEPGDPLGPGHIYSSNTFALAALVREAGGVPRHLGIARDSEASLREAFARLPGCDALLTIGGVSVGDFDYVKQVLQDLGAEQEFWRVAMRPGKPNAFGTLSGVPTWGLPGNPVSAMVSFLQYVRPALRMMQGDPTPYLPVIEAELAEPVRTKPGFLFFLRGVLGRGDDGRRTVRTTGPQGSGILASMARADCLVIVDEDTRDLPAGATVRVQLLPWGLAGGADADLR